MQQLWPQQRGQDFAADKSDKDFFYFNCLFQTPQMSINIFKLSFNNGSLGLFLLQPESESMGFFPVCRPVELSARWGAGKATQSKF